MDPQTVQLLSLALEAPLWGDRWEDFLDAFTDNVGAIFGACTISAPNHETRDAIFRSRLLRGQGEEIERRYVQDEGADDAPGVLRLHQKPLERLFTEAELLEAPPEALPPNRLRDFLREAYGVRHRAGMALNAYVDRRDLLWLNFPEARDPQEPALRSQIDVFGPILGKSLRLFRIFEALRARFRATLTALDQLGLGAILMVEDGQIVLANATAQAMLDKADGLRVDPAGRLLACSEEFAPALRQAVADLWNTVRLKGWNAETAFTVDRPSGRPPYLMTLGPMVDSLGELERGLGCVMAFLADPAGATPISVEGLRLAGGLTEAEAEVCRLVINGSSTEEISERRNVSSDTVRKQVKAAMAKLGCSSRLDLVRLALHTRLPIRE